MLTVDRVTLKTLIYVIVISLGLKCQQVDSKHVRTVVKELNDLQKYIEELEFIEDQEFKQGLAGLGKPTVAEETIFQTCDLLIHDELKIDNNANIEDLVKADLVNWDDCYRRWSAKLANAQWDYETNMTDANEAVLTDASVRMSKWVTDLAKNAKLYCEHSQYETLSYDIKRQLRLMAFNTSPKEKSDAEALIKVQSKLQNTYSSATVFGYHLEPELVKVMAESRDGGVLLGAWDEWRNATGPYMKQDYTTLVKLLNQGAIDNGFDNYATAWINSQFDETDNLEEMAEQLWQEILPLYEELHAYIRTKLADVYPEYKDIFEQGGIPAHITGNMWAQDWGNIYDLVKPYKNVDEPNIDDEMVAQGYTVDHMFNMAEDFYTSIGLFPMSDTFKSRSMKVRPENLDVVCHAAAFDFYSKKPEKDFRIKMCTEINAEYFETIHHEMGHIEYFMAYQDQPTTFRNGANSAFHEAVGDTISLSVLSKKHLETVGLIDTNNIKGENTKKSSSYNRILKMLENDKGEINFLLQRALFKIAFIPFGYMIDKWRWGVFRGDIKEENYNQRWWDLRLQYQGIVAPVTRSENDFDPGAKFHIPSNSPYICYFISFIVQFQFYEAMCDASGHTGQLHTCDFYQSKEAGQKLMDMLKLGMSKPWPEAMERLTGSREISTGSIMRYFSKLYDWLKKENKRNGVHIGWDNAKINWDF